MAKKRTGLQSQIASIFSGVPVPKKDRAGSEPPGAPPQPAGPERPPPKAPPPGPVPPKFQPPVEPVREIPPMRAAAPKIPEPRVGRVPTVPRRKKERLAAPRAGGSSSRQRVAAAMVVVLSILLVVLLVRPFQSRPSQRAASGTAGQAAAGASPRANVKIDWPVLQKYPEKLRDPMILGVPQKVPFEPRAAVVVKGITYSADRRFAVIGTQTVQEGDFVEGTKIRINKINPNSVEFEEDGKTWTQPVQSEGN